MIRLKQDFKIEYNQLKYKNREDIVIIDIRDDVAFNYGHIMGAINIPYTIFFEKIEDFRKDKEYIIYSQNGEFSEKIVTDMRKKGFIAFDFFGGYVDYIKNHIFEANESETLKKVELSIRKRFKKEIFGKFVKAINEYEMIKPNDKIAVCISGGKDSMLLAKLFQELKKHNKFAFQVEFIVMDPGYSKANREVIERNLKMLNIPATIFESDIFDSVYNIEKSPCYLCARMRRGYLYSKAKELGCNKIALGHHYDDVIETIVMGMLYGAQIQTMMPKLHSTNFEGMELIRPLYLVREEDIKRWRDYNDLYFIQCACKFTDNSANESCLTNINTSSKRQKIKNLIKDLSKEDPQIVYNIFRSVENVNLSTVIAYKDKHNITHNFLDNYDKF